MNNFRAKTLSIAKSAKEINIDVNNNLFSMDYLRCLIITGAINKKVSRKGAKKSKARGCLVVLHAL
jgi:hypothetical protein